MIYVRVSIAGRDMQNGNFLRALPSRNQEYRRQNDYGHRNGSGNSSSGSRIGSGSGRHRRRRHCKANLTAEYARRAERNRTR